MARAQASARTAATTRTKVGQDISSLGKLIFLYDANKITGVANGGTVASWSDNSGNGFTVSQATENLKPTLVTNADTFGNACTRWAGGQVMTATIAAEAQPLTFFSVAKVSSMTTNVARAMLGSGATFEYGYYNQGGTPRAFIYGGTILFSSEISIGIIYINIGVLNGASSNIYLDGVAGTAGNVGSSGLGTTLTLGSYSGTDFFNGDIYLVGCFRGLLGAGQRIALTRILGERFQKSITE